MYEEVINKQTAFFNSNITKDLSFRIEQLRKLKSVIKANETEIYKAIYNDFKKSQFDTYTTELSFIYNDISTAIKNLPQWTKWKKTGTNFINFPAKSYIIPEPLGVCLVLGTWNYPYQISLCPMIAAIAAGNTVVIKPSELAPATSALIAKLVNVNFPDNYLKVIEGGIFQTKELLKQKFDKIFFTGSITTAKIVYEAGAKYLTPVTLELGGKNPAIVTENCNLRDAAKRLVWGKFLNSGQTCTAPDYVLVHKNVEEEFLKHLKDYVIQFKYSYENKNYVQIINSEHWQRLINLIDKSKLFSGGENDPVKLFIAPTILNDVTFEDKVMEEEIFGPILPVISYTDLDSIILKLKALPKPLSLYIFTKSRNVKNKILSELSFGGGAVNEVIMQMTNDNLPFGGVGSSGTGSYHGISGFATFSHYKSILEKPGWRELNLKYSPYTENKLKWLKRFVRG